MKVLIATDIHLGHKFDDPNRKHDSFQAFQEVLQIAKTQSVDFLLLGGDLYDVTNPKKQVLHMSFEIMSKYVFKESISQKTNQKINRNKKQLQQENQRLQVQGYEPNFYKRSQIALPIFTIHGNHDYPDFYQKLLSIVELVHSTGMVNYFGNYYSAQIVIKPIKFKKKTENGKIVKLALYGLGHIKDAYINFLHSQGKIFFERPNNEKMQFQDQKQQDQEDYFCLFIHHQNRYKGKRNGCASENCVQISYIPKWMDLTIWAHQHEPILQVFQEQKRTIYQPGSTILTSFKQCQTFVKQAPLLTIYPQKQYTIKPFFLNKSYRPIYVIQKSVDQLIRKAQQLKSSYGYQLTDTEKQNQRQNVNIVEVIKDSLISQLYDLIKQAQESNIQQGRSPNKKPIIRFTIHHQDFKIPVIQIQNKMQDLVANPNKIFKFIKKKAKNDFYQEKNVQMDIEEKNNKKRPSNQKDSIDQFMKMERKIQQGQPSSLIQNMIKKTNKFFQESQLNKQNEKGRKSNKKNLYPYRKFDFKFYNYDQFETDLKNMMHQQNNSTQQNLFKRSLDTIQKKHKQCFKQECKKQKHDINQVYNRNLNSCLKIINTYEKTDKNSISGSQINTINDLRKNLFDSKAYKKQSNNLMNNIYTNVTQKQSKKITNNFHLNYVKEKALQRQIQQQKVQYKNFIKKSQKSTNNQSLTVSQIEDSEDQCTHNNKKKNSKGYNEELVKQVFNQSFRNFQNNFEGNKKGGKKKKAGKKESKNKNKQIQM